MNMKTEGFAKTAPLSLLNDPSLLKTDALINGHWVKGTSRFDVHDPATGQKLADVANLNAKDAQAAIDAANAAWPAWRSKTGKERSIILRKWFDLLMANQEDLGRIMTAEQGKPFAEAKGEVAYGASFVEWFAEEAVLVGGVWMAESKTQRWRLKNPAVAASSISDTEVGTITKSYSNINSPAIESVHVKSQMTTSVLLAARRRCKRASKIGRLPPWSRGRMWCCTTTPILGARVNQVLEEPWVSKSINVTVWPWRRRYAAKLAETVLLPTPPF